MSSECPVAVVYNDENNDQALYVNGKLHTADESVYVCHIVDAIGDVPFRLVQVEIDWSGDEWPDREEELIEFLRKTKQVVNRRKEAKTSENH
jgi:hypothetical protein